ncbi:hypothetical protein ECZU22_51280 [Escherichia coli]|nr:hypothetical protein ECZU22_51280 [Escherichia coli]
MEQINSNKKHSDRRKYFALLAVVLFIALSGAYAYWSMELKDMISTDDAYVTGNADPISAQVSGSVTVVNHKDTNYVRQGDILVSLDKTDATIALNKAKIIWQILFGKRINYTYRINNTVPKSLQHVFSINNL